MSCRLAHQQVAEAVLSRLLRMGIGANQV